MTEALAGDWKLAAPGAGHGFGSDQRTAAQPSKKFIMSCCSDSIEEYRSKTQQFFQYRLPRTLFAVECSERTGRQSNCGTRSEILGTRQEHGRRRGIQQPYVCP